MSMCPNPVLFFLTTNFRLIQIQHKTPYEFIKSSEEDKSNPLCKIRCYPTIKARLYSANFPKAVQYEQCSQVLPTAVSNDRVCLSNSSVFLERGVGKKLCSHSLIA